ncbi:hypothetical protein L593_08930 [Salinarchaeum sp. Harcht-Bsk1]|uniref:winged helix-turn-helix domain-containing protein n=1 Tax=Salinarchaeum sp. Harcht-Bsk1 TaxID=1333523 RepID=UPI0003424110|nr:winged helix-turn-helix domain-containing protein [Salinarchaeum sp. Harcht-Bsk1]AGN01731.1 hypothetical protein L593_08930 [Salinarchaeum sp. Harcht-Bsk1]
MATTQAPDEEAYADGTPIVELLGDSARVKLLSVFAGKRSREFTISELAENAGISRKSVYNHVDELVEFGVAQPIEAGSGTRYRTAETAVAQKLFELDGVTLQRLVE